MRRPLAWGLIIYGILGLALVVIGAVVGLDLAARIERTAALAGGSLEAATRATRAAADSFDSVDGSLTEAQTSADGAADLARDASGTLDALAAAMNLSILGSQPLAPLSDQFGTSADQADQLAETLESVSTSLGDTRTDVATIGVELDLLSRELEELSELSGTESGSPSIRLFVGLLLAWLAIPAIGALLYGAALLRPPIVVAPPGPTA